MLTVHGVNNCTVYELVENVPGAHLGFSAVMLAGYIMSELLGPLLEVFCMSFVISFYWTANEFQYFCFTYGGLQDCNFHREPCKKTSTGKIYKTLPNYGQH